MPMRPVDAIFVDPKQRLYVIYQSGEMWQLPRMKIDMAAWNRRQPYSGDKNALYLSRRQAINDKALAQKLRTLNLPATAHGISLPRFEAWWEVQGFNLLKGLIDKNISPLAAYDNHADNIGSPTSNVVNSNELIVENIAAINRLDSLKTTDNSTKSSTANLDDKNHKVNTQPTKLSNDTSSETDIFATMLAELTDEVLSHR